MTRTLHPPIMSGRRPIRSVVKNATQTNTMRRELELDVRDLALCVERDEERGAREGGLQDDKVG